MTNDFALRLLRMHRDTTLAARERAHAAMVTSNLEHTKAVALRAKAYEALCNECDKRDIELQRLNQLRQINTIEAGRLNEPIRRALKYARYSLNKAERARDAGEINAFELHLANTARYTDEHDSYVAQQEAFSQAIAEAQARYENEILPRVSRAREELNKRSINCEATRTAHLASAAVYDAAVEANERATRLYQAELAAYRVRMRELSMAYAVYTKVPIKHLRRVKVRRSQAGNVDIYFAGLDRPDGPGHGHYAVNSDGKVIYRRDPMRPRGPENFTDHPKYLPSRICHTNAVRPRLIAAKST